MAYIGLDILCMVCLAYCQLLPVSCLTYSFTLKMEDIYSSETSDCLQDTQKTIFFTATAVRTSNFIQIKWAIHFKNIIFMPPSMLKTGITCSYYQLNMKIIMFIRWTQLSHWLTIWHLLICLLLVTNLKVELQVWLLAGDLPAWVTSSMQL
jgi:hypothetical protein